MKRVFAALAAFLMCVSLCSCKGNGGTDETTKEYNVPTPVINADVSLPYIGTDSLDPFKVKSTLNADLMSAIFESLYEPSQDGKGAPLLASSGEISGKTARVTLKSKIKFSDKTELTAQSVIKSFSLAKSSERFSKQLSNIASVTADDNYSLVFTLNEPSEFALNVLNFPIVSGSGGGYAGTGAYKIAYLDGEIYLEANEYHEGYKKSTPKQIALYDMAGVSSAVYPFKANEISVYKNDLSSGEYTNLSSKTVSVPTNNFVYAGVNMNWKGSLLSLDFVRHAVNIGIDRKTIAASSFLGQCTATSTPFKSEVYVFDEQIPDSGNKERAVAVLEENGFYETESGVRSNGNTSLSVSILVCSDNKYKVDAAESLKKSLEALGFGVTINKQDKEGYLKILSGGHFDIYIGETALTDDYDFSEFFDKKGALNFGISEDYFKEYASFKSGETTVSRFVEGFYTAVPFVPLFYRSAVLSVNPNLEGVSVSGGIYKNVGNWSFKSK